MLLTRCRKGVFFSVKGIQKGYFSVKVVNKRARGWSLGWSLPVQNLIDYILLPWGGWGGGLIAETDAGDRGVTSNKWQYLEQILVVFILTRLQVCRSTILNKDLVIN